MAIVALDMLSAFFGSAISPPFSGVLVYRSTNQSIPNGANTLVLWELAEDDQGGWFGAPDDGFVTVPAGVTRVQLAGSVSWGSTAGTERHIDFRKNSVPALGFSNAQYAAISITTPIVSPVVAVIPGDEISLFVQHDAGPSIAAVAGNYTYLSVYAIR